MTLLRTTYLSVAVLLCVTACEKQTQTNTPPENALNISIGASPQTLDPHLATGTPSSKILAALGESLVDKDLETYKITPGVAERWQISDDGLTYTFFIRANARWSNGDPVTAHDFVFTWQRAMTPSVGWQYATDYYFIEGAKALHTGKQIDKHELGVKALDDHTLVFSLERPYPIFLEQLSSERQMPLHRKSIEAVGDAYDSSTNWTTPDSYVSNGPFVLKKWDINRIIELEKNPYYWDVDSVRLDKIYAHPIESESADERAFRAGQIDLSHAARIPVDKIAVYQRERPEQLRIVSAYGTYFYHLNVNQAPLDNILVRRALAHAIDRQSIVENITKAGEGVATTLNPPVSGYVDLVTPLEYNLDTARQLLADAGYPNGEGFPEFALIYNTSDAHRKVALAIQQMWKVNLGINVRLENQEWKIFLYTRRNQDYAIARAGSISDIGDPQDFLESYRTDHEMNDSGWSNAQFDILVTQASNTVNTDERYALLAEAESILLDQLPIIPIYYYSYSYLINEKVKGVQFNSLSRINFKSIYISEGEE